MILLIDGEKGYFAIGTALLAPFNLMLDRAKDVAEAVERLALKHYALIVVALPMPGINESGVTPVLRAAMGEAACPIAAMASLDGGEAPRLAQGFNGLIATPFDAESFLSAIGCWLNRSDLVSHPDDAVEKLAPLMGKKAAEGMVSRVMANLADGVSEIDGGGDKRALGHRLGGLAGTVGLMQLSAAWLALQDDAKVWPTVRAITKEALECHGA